MIKKFLSYVEIMTKITSVFPFLLALAYLLYLENPISWGPTVIFFAAMFIFDLTTTAINNYIDTKTNHQQLQFPRKTALVIIFVLFFISTGLGIWLALMTDVVVLVIGAFCFLFGVLYTYGPVPISRQPLGELFSGIFYGFAIPFLLLYINLPSGYYFSFFYANGVLSLTFRLFPILVFFLLFAIPTFLTANIMLANNICDREKDVKVNRFTLAFYLGKWSLPLLAALYYACYLAVVAVVVLGALSPLYLLFLLTLFPVQKNIQTFWKKQEKSSTFLTSIQNYILMMTASVLLVFVSALLPH